MSELFELGMSARVIHVTPPLLSLKFAGAENHLPGLQTTIEAVLPSPANGLLIKSGSEKSMVHVGDRYTNT